MLQYSRDPRAVELVVHWVKEMDDSRFSSVAPVSLLRDSGVFGLKSQLHTAMYGMLLAKPQESLRERANAILEALRLFNP